MDLLGQPLEIEDFSVSLEGIWKEGKGYLGLGSVSRGILWYTSWQMPENRLVHCGIRMISPPPRPERDSGEAAHA